MYTYVHGYMHSLSPLYGHKDQSNFTVYIFIVPRILICLTIHLSWDTQTHVCTAHIFAHRHINYVDLIEAYAHTLSLHPSFLLSL